MPLLRLTENTYSIELAPDDDEGSCQTTDVSFEFQFTAGEQGYFASALPGADPGDVFALAVMEDIPKANVLIGDRLICNRNKRPQPGDLPYSLFQKMAGISCSAEFTA